MEVSKDWLESVLKNHSKETSVDKIICLETEPAVGKGECYSSQIVRVKLKILYASGKTANRSVLYKKLPDNEDLRQFLTEYNAFPAEIDTFSDIIPRMDELMSEHGDTNEKLWCDCLWFNRYDQLVLQDLKEMGYRNLARQSGMNVEHGVVTLNALGRLHGMSAILLQKKRIHPGLLKPYPMGRNDPTSNHLLSLGCSILAQVIKENWGSEW
ncbi:hypothetical protein AAG570_000681 [Ranatra chinensis]|uniref:Uncharacterized protein n=1 Tax=Ranatra chinensis TaxID=642074 RepID=A0ABD0YYH1_9HEMI